ncbi:MAG: acyl-CoA dehydrogenase family protein [Haloarculaceae archaeon]
MQVEPSVVSMGFELTAAQQALQDESASLAETEIEPVAADLDAAGEHPTEILQTLGDAGFGGLTVSTEYGGRGADLVGLTVVTEELAAALMPVASALALHLGVAEAVERFGSDDLRADVLPELARFETVGALGLSEANAGSDKLGMETTAERDGDEWVLDGHKRWVTNFRHADVVLTYARTGPDADAPHNVSAFLVPTGAFEVEHVWDTLGARCVKSPKVTLSSVRVPDADRVGAVGEAYVQRGQLHTGVNVPARAVGIARAAIEDSVAHVADREQFGHAIGDFQGVRWRVAEMATSVDAARSLTRHAAAAADRGDDPARESAAAKIFATETAVDVTNQALQLHGGIGYTTERDVERYLRDARLLTIAGGPNEGHRDALADAVFERYG